MALSVTSWPQSVGLRVVHEDAIGLSPNQNCLGSGGTIKLGVFDNSEGSADVYIKIRDAISASSAEEPEWIFRVKAGKKEVVYFESCGSFSGGLSFWASAGANAGNNTPPSVNTNGTVKVTLIADQTREQIDTVLVGY